MRQDIVTRIGKLISLRQEDQRIKVLSELHYEQISLYTNHFDQKNQIACISFFKAPDGKGHGSKFLDHDSPNQINFRFHKRGGHLEYSSGAGDQTKI